MNATVTGRQALDLIAAILALPPGAAELSAVLKEAHVLGVDVLALCAHRHGLGDQVVMERAAHWAGLRYASQILTQHAETPPLSNLDALAGVRTLRGHLDGQSVVFTAPDFEGLLRLCTQIEQQADLNARICLVTRRTLHSALVTATGAALSREARERLIRRWPFASAMIDLTLGTRMLFVGAMLGLILITALAPVLFDVALLPLVAVLLLTPSTLRIAATVSSACQPATKLPPLLSDAALPIYTVLLPLRDEAQMVPQLALAMMRLDYPPEKLDIKFVVEADCPATLAAIRNLLDQPRFELVAIPQSKPRTKPKAMNFALPLVRGRYMVVYDAEDIPDPGQLRLAASWFAAHPEIDCLQAELTIDNASETWLTALFAGEYAGQFRLMLPALARWNLAMPLGGTSNHFPVATLRALGGWDAYNVTEDADLGTRLRRLRYRVAMLPSQTREEAPVGVPGWMAQRTRWMKGWMQTFIVHNRASGAFLHDMGWRAFTGFQIYVGSLLVSAPLHTLFFALVLIRILLGTAGLVAEPGSLSFVYLAILALGYGGTVIQTVAALWLSGRRHLILPQFALPFYWILHSIATVRAAHELLVKPFFWAKTSHGRTQMPR